MIWTLKMRICRWITVIAFLAITAPAHSQWTRGGGYKALAGPIAVLGNKIFAGNMSMAIEGDPPNGIPPDSGLWVSEDTGKTWKPVGFSGINVVSFCAKDSLLLAGTLVNGIFLSTDTGQSWVLLDSTVGFYEVPAMAIKGNIFFAGSTIPPFVFRSTDKGRSWKNCEISTWPLGSFFVSDSFIFAGAGIDLSSSVSSDEGLTWNYCNGDIFDAFASVGNSIFAASNRASEHHLWHNDGKGWKWDQRKGEGITDTGAITCMVAHGNDLFVGTSTYPGSGYIYRSTDSGDSWQNVSEGMDSNARITSLAILGDYIIAGDENDGMIRRILSDFDKSEVNNSSPPAMTLSQNAPNPASVSTAFSYTLPYSEEVRVGLYDVMGREVRVLASGRVDAGTHFVTIDAETLAPGVYYYRIEAASGVATRRMVMQ